MSFSLEICSLHLLFSVVFFFLFLLYGTHVATRGYVVLALQLRVRQTFSSFTFSPSRPSAICSVIMFHCPNPDCLRNVKKSRKPFASTQGLSVHLTLFPGCKAFVFQSSASSTSTQHVSAQPSMFPRKRKS